MPDASSIKIWLSGAPATGAFQASHSESLGGYRSSVRADSLTVVRHDALAGVSIDFVAGLNGPGNGSLRVVSVDSLAWTAPGSATEGAAVTIANGQQKYLIDGEDTSKYIIVTRSTSDDLIGVETVALYDTFNNVFGGRNFTAAETAAGESIYQAVIIELSSADAAYAFAWIDPVCDGEMRIATEALVSGAIQTIPDETTAPGGVSWSATVSEETPLALTLLAGPGTAYVGLWIERSIAMDAAASARILRHLHIFTSDIVDGEALFYHDMRGLGRNANAAAERWEIYDGIDEEPDLTGEPDATFTSSPEAYALSADHVHYVKVLPRNQWGVRTDAGDTQIYRVAADGSLDATPPQGPVYVELRANGDGTVAVTALYLPAKEGILESAIAATRPDAWLVYLTADGADPDPEVDTPAEVAMSRSGGPENLLHTTAAQLEGAPVKVLVRTRRTGVEADPEAEPPVEEVPDSDSENTAIESVTAEWWGPARPAGVVTLGRSAGVQQEPPSADEDAVTWIDEANNIYWQALPGETQLWADTVLVWRLLWTSGNVGADRELRTFFNAAYEAVSGAGTGAAEWDDGNQTLYLNVNGAHAMRIDVANQVIYVANVQGWTEPSETTRAPAPCWGKYAGTCLQVWDPVAGEWTTAAALESSGFKLWAGWRRCADEAEVLS